MNDVPLALSPEPIARFLGFPRDDPLEQIFWFLLGVLVLTTLAWFLQRAEERSRPPRLPVPDPAEGRRAFRRALVRLPADVLLERRPLPMEGRLRDLSIGGATVLLERAVPERTVLQIAFDPDGEGEEEFRAEVVRCEGQGPLHSLHCGFVDLDGARERRLQRAVDALDRARLHGSAA